MKLFGEKEWDIDRICRFILGVIVIYVVFVVLSTLRSVSLPFTLDFLNMIPYFGTLVGLKPVTILMSAVIWGTLLGLTDLLLVIPLSAIEKVYLHRYFMVKEEIDEQTKEDPTATSKKEQY